MNDRGHQAQHTACTLELLDARPVGEEAVKEFGMDRIGVLETALVFGFVAITRELLAIVPVELGKGFGNGVALGIIQDCIKEAAAYDLKAFVAVGGSPGRFDTPNDLLEANGGFTSTFAANLNCGSTIVLVIALVFGCGDGDYDQGTRRYFGGFG
jgi:hypothetical protein